MAQARHILMVVTGHDRIDDEHRTGIWFEEFAVPYQAFKEQGWQITVASPRGGSVPVDPRSEPKDEEAQKYAEARAQLHNTRPLAGLNAADYDAIFLPGGHGVMFDLAEDTTLHRLLADFERQGKIIAAVCHGPAGLVGARRDDGQPLVAGKTITAFTDEEERATGLDKFMPFLLETRLRELGANFVARPNWSDHVERDGRLITGQNPQSSASIARAVIEALS
ncbi:type 1 glutamine amidotransferase domain-containing protein [Thermogemmatispora sp.]|uniref:type 1 glutamine amidotransferase domain-containing protein n=1 Tax=Thermogemmatispora sp. TaxID=1968838 RepID=UPI00263982C7|nr:type 1 glutamine amidotransferase domain-containing protein [Thermogemmatispora sp.]